MNPITTSHITLTVKQVEAINRLGRNGWSIELKDFAVERDGFLSGLMASMTNPDYKLYVGIHPDGSSHT